MRKGRLSAWASALVMASGGLNPGNAWPLAMGAWAFHHTNNGSPAPDWA